MGLDMFLVKVKGKYTSEEIWDISKYNRFRDDKKYFDDILEDTKTLSRQDMIAKYYKRDIEDFNKYLEAYTENDDILTVPIRDWIIDDRANEEYFKLMSDFTKDGVVPRESLNKFLKENIEGLISNAEVRVKGADTNLELIKVKLNLDVLPETSVLSNTEELAYWRKDYELDDYFREVAICNKGGQEEFNVLPITLCDTDISDVLDFIDTKMKYLDEFKIDEDVSEDMDRWKDTKSIFEKVLDETDFENETVIYYNWW